MVKVIVRSFKGSSSNLFCFIYSGTPSISSVAVKWDVTVLIKLLGTNEMLLFWNDSTFLTSVFTVKCQEYFGLVTKFSSSQFYFLK